MKKFKEKLKDLEKSKKFFEWMWRLDGRPEDKTHTQEIVNNISEKGIDGYCEDVALFFWLSYEDVEIIQTNCHFCVKYKDKYYDAFNRDGVKHLKDLEYWKRNPDDSTEISPYQWEGILPDFYYNSAKDLLPFADRIKPKEIEEENES